MMAISPEASNVATITADAEESSSLEAMCSKTKVLISFVGPYLGGGRGMRVARACVASKTDYCDITGESPFQKQLVEELHEDAKSNGVSLVTACGFDSVPFDLGTYEVIKRLGPDAGRVDIEAIMGPSRGGVSGGTIASISGITPLPTRVLDPTYDAKGSKQGAKTTPHYRMGQFHPRSSTFLGPSIMEPINKKVVWRSAGLLGYGSGAFSYGEFTGCSSRLANAGFTLSLGAIGAVLSSGKIRSFLIARGIIPKPGEGPSRQMLESGFFNVMVYGKAEGSGRECVCHVRGIDGDPGYKLTGAMALEAAICLATSPDVQRRGGVLTPAVCMGDVLPEYTAKANVTFTTTDVAPPLFEACKPPESKL